MKRKATILLLVIFAPLVITAAFFLITIPAIYFAGLGDELSVEGVGYAVGFFYLFWLVNVIWLTCTKKGRESLGVRW